MSQKTGQPSEQLTSLIDLLQSLPQQQRQQIEDLIQEQGTQIWTPTPGPQSEAYYTNADITFYGGAAGGGKTDLAIGLALTTHTESMILRREATQLEGIYERMTEILGSRDGFNSTTRKWRLSDRMVEFGSVKDAGDEMKYQGRPHSLLVFDEITHFNEYQFTFLMGWNRTAKDGEPIRTLCTGNPPTDSDGEWVIRYWAPWLDPKHPNPANPGELRWYAMLSDGVERPVESGDIIIDPTDGEEVKPVSRTFIPSRVEDNPFLMAQGYKSKLQAMPEPLRSQMLKGDFQAGISDDPWQVIPTDWVDAAQARWSPDYIADMDSMGADIARGGTDHTVVVCRHGGWFSDPVSVPGVATPNGQTGAALVIQHRRDLAPVHVDVIGVGGSVYDHLDENGIQAIPVNVSKKTHKKAEFGGLGFKNLRAQLYWDLRESLDPRSKSLLALPPSSEVKADLCSARFRITPGGIQVESKEDIRKRIGRSPDVGDAILLAHIETDKRNGMEDDEWGYVERDNITGY
jgi:hypothetical protein